MSTKELTFTFQYKDITATSKPLKVTNKIVEITDITKGDFISLAIPNCQTKSAATDLIRISFRLRYFVVKEFGFRVEDEQGETIYEQRFLPDIVVVPDEEEPPKKTYHNPGDYIIKWDGFDQHDVYNSQLMKGNLSITVFATCMDDEEESDQKTIKWGKMMVDWMDVTINKKTKIINVLLRLDLRDKGAVGLDPEKYDPGSKIYKQADWKNVPKAVVDKEKKDPIKSKTKNFEQLKQLVFDGVNKYWSREVTIGKDKYIVNTVAVDSKVKCMDDLGLRYCTNQAPGRSGNPGSATLNPYTWVANIAWQRVYYNVGYLYNFKEGWRYRSETNAENNFKETAAHEIGHEILKSFGGATYSYEHKGTSTMTQNGKKGVKYKYPANTEEIDLMKYYDFNEEDDDSVWSNYYSRIKAAEEDILGMLWLIKVSVK